MSKKVQFMIMGFVLVVLLVGGLIGVRLLLPSRSEATVPEEPEPEGIGELYQAQGITVNPAGTKGARILRVSVALEVADGGSLAEFEERDVQIRDILIRQLASHTISELMAPEQREVTKQEIIDQINELLTGGTLADLYFTEYLIQ